MNTIEEELRSFLTDNFALDGTVSPIGLTDSLIEAGVVDSTGLLELVLFVETRYGFEVPDVDLLPENFETLANISRYIAARTETKAVTAQPAAITER
jgi:acyl carrier protein